MGLIHFFRMLFTRQDNGAPALPAEPAGLVGFNLADYLSWNEGLPQLDGVRAFQYLQILPPDTRQEAGTRIQAAWLQALQGVLGNQYALTENENCLLLSALPAHVARAVCHTVTQVEQMVGELFKEMSVPETYGKQLILILSDSDAYYRYLAALEGESRDFPRSSATFINSGCPHFVTHEGEMASIDAIIVHELTHDALSHLPLPTWLGEGLALVVEQRMTSRNGFDLSGMGERLRHWQPANLESFWSGESFDEDGDSAEGAEALAFLMVRHLIGRGDSFFRFLEHAHAADAGEGAAREFLGVELEELAKTLLRASA
jgi:hypothetical protein